MSILFKYMSGPRHILKDGFIRATQLEALNDPFEAIYCEKGLKELVKHFDESSVFLVGIGEISFSEYVELNKNNIGVISFSESKENLLMWAHYGDEHRGVALGLSRLDFDKGMFVNLVPSSTVLLATSWEGYGPFDGVPRPVMYRKQPRYRIDKFDYDYSNISVEGADRILFEVFLQKSEEWIYEKEHRIILRLEQADKAIIFDLDKIDNHHVKNSILASEFCSYNDDGGYYDILLMGIEDEIERKVFSAALTKLSKNKKNIYLFKLKPNSISHCLLGLNCELEYSDVRQDYVSSVGYYEVWKAKMNADNYSIEFEEVK